jgi:hypothetical protein
MMIDVIVLRGKWSLAAHLFDAAQKALMLARSKDLQVVK